MVDWVLVDSGSFQVQQISFGLAEVPPLCHLEVLSALYLSQLFASVSMCTSNSAPRIDYRGTSYRIWSLSSRTGLVREVVSIDVRILAVYNASTHVATGNWCPPSRFWDHAVRSRDHLLVLILAMDGVVSLQEVSAPTISECSTHVE